MRLYLVKVGGRVRYAGSQADARGQRDGLMAATNTKKKDTEVDEVDVPTQKAGLLEHLNKLCEGFDSKADA